ncbi:MAG TPA: hypothetical protein PLV72_02700 [Candidatus Magasanikbacteria bacterium]|nr:hypothetical protein [Candidatus Magasanikbacteria bacterium]
MNTIRRKKQRTGPGASVRELQRHKDLVGAVLRAMPVDLPGHVMQFWITNRRGLSTVLFASLSWYRSDYYIRDVEAQYIKGQNKRVDQFAEFVSAVVGALPRNLPTDNLWIRDGERLKSVLRSVLMNLDI